MVKESKYYVNHAKRMVQRKIEGSEENSISFKFNSRVTCNRMHVLLTKLRDRDIKSECNISNRQIIFYKRNKTF